MSAEVPGRELERLLNSEHFVELSDDQLRSFNFGLTTFDNFFDPFEDFKSWFAFDQQKNYNSSGLIDRFFSSLDELGPIWSKRILVYALQDIVHLNASGMHTIIVRPVSEKTETDEQGR